LVYANEYRYYLYRISEKKILSKIDTGTVTNPPIWSPDGSKFIVFGDFDEFYIGTDDGKVSKITELNQNKQTSEVDEVSADFYSWSPDNRHVAFWLHLGGETEIFGTLAVLDTKTGDITDYCIPEMQPYSFQWPPYPIWSPDGKQLIVGYNYHKDKDANEVLLIDFEKMIAFPISQNNNPAGWLKTR
jgi:Tol biopolymer transport system component